MKPRSKSTGLQLNLPLLNVQAATLPEGKQRELALTLVELLISGVPDRAEGPAAGGGDEPEANS